MARKVETVEWKWEVVDGVCPLLVPGYNSLNLLQRPDGVKLTVALSTNDHRFTKGKVVPKNEFAPAFVWIEGVDTVHLTAVNPFTCILEGPATYVSPIQASQEYHSESFRIRPRFSVDPVTKYEEFTEMLKNEWSSQNKFETYWKQIFADTFLNSIEARVQIFLRRMEVNASYTTTGPVASNSNMMSPYTAKRIMYLVRVAEYITLYAEKLQAVSDGSDVDGGGWNKKNGSTGNKKKARPDTGEDDLGGRNMLERCLKNYMSNEDYIAYKALSADAKAIASEVLAISTSQIEGSYLNVYKCFVLAVQNVGKLIFNKAKKNSYDAAAFAKEVETITLLESELQFIALSPTNIKAHDNNTYQAVLDAISDVNALGYTISQELDTHGTNGNKTAATAAQNKLSDGFASERTVRQAETGISCSAIAQAVLSIWRKTLSQLDHQRKIILLKDDEILAHYALEAKLREVEIAAKRVDEESASRPRKSSTHGHAKYGAERFAEGVGRKYEPTLVFPSVMLFSEIPLTHTLLTIMQRCPAWLLTLSRLLDRNETARIKFMQNSSDFIRMIASFDNTNSSVIATCLNFMLRSPDDLFASKTFDKHGNMILDKILASLGPETVFAKPNAFNVMKDDPIYNHPKNNAASIELFNNVWMRISPTPHMRSESWCNVISCMRTISGHFIENVNKQCQLFRDKSSRLNPVTAPIPLHVYQIIPHSVIPIKLPNSLEKVHTLPRLDPTQSVYYYHRRSRQVDLLHPGAPTFDVSAGPLENKENMAIYVCRRQYMETWIRIAEFLKSNAASLGDWTEYMRCRTAVDCSLLMSQVIRTHYTDPKNSLARGNGIILYFPALIYEQIMCVMDESDSPFTYNWIVSNRMERDDNDFNLKFATKETLAAILSESDDFYKHPVIYVVHGEAMNTSEWSELINVFESEKPRTMRNQLIRQSDPNSFDFNTCYIYLTFCPVLGGFSPSVDTNRHDSTVYHLLTLSSAINRWPMDIAKIKQRAGKQLRIPAIWHHNAHLAVGSELTSMGRELLDDYNTNNQDEATGDYDADKGNARTKARMRVLEFCQRMLLMGDPASNTSGVLDEEDMDVEGLVDPYVANRKRKQVEVERLRHLFDNLVIHNEKQNYSPSIKLYWTTFLSNLNVKITHEQPMRPKILRRSNDDEEEEESVPPSLNSKQTVPQLTPLPPSSAANLRPVAQVPVPFELSLMQHSVPKYQVLQAAEASSYSIPLIKIPLGILDRIPPMRLANLLACSRQHTYCLVGKAEYVARKWKEYCIGRARLPDSIFYSLETPEQLAANMEDGLASIIPIHAFENGVRSEHFADLKGRKPPDLRKPAHSSRTTKTPDMPRHTNPSASPMPTTHRASDPASALDMSVEEEDSDNNNNDDERDNGEEVNSHEEDSMDADIYIQRKVVSDRMSDVDIIEEEIDSDDRDMEMMKRALRGDTSMVYADNKKRKRFSEEEDDDGDNERGQLASNGSHPFQWPMSSLVPKSASHLKSMQTQPSPFPSNLIPSAKRQKIKEVPYDN